MCAHVCVYGHEMILSEQTLQVKHIICSHTWMNVAIYSSNLKGKSDKIPDLTFGNIMGTKYNLHQSLMQSGQSTYTIRLRC